MEFTKMVAAGNDFVVFNGLPSKIKDYSELAIKACNRHFSVGGDGILICEKSESADIKMIYYNSDGSRGEMCGNGIRCFSQYVYEEGLVKSKSFTVETIAGIKYIKLEIEDDKVKFISVNMGKPSFAASDIPVKIERDKAIEEILTLDGEDIVYSSLLVGVPHTVIFTEDINKVDINTLGRKIETHSLFPKKTNVNFIEVLSKNEINIFTWERGAGRTLGCGTGSCASVVIGSLLGKLGNEVKVNTEGGKLEVLLKSNNDIYMKGDAIRICDGVFLNSFNI